MTDQAASLQPASSPQAAALWHLGWALGVIAAGAALLAGLGEIAWPALAALGSGAAPGVVGYFWQPRGRGRLVLLMAWSLASVLAAVLTGGLTGPFGLWCATPLLAGALTGALAEGAALGAAVLATTALLQLGGVVIPAPAGTLGLGLAAAGLLTAGGGAGGVLAMLLRRTRPRADRGDAVPSEAAALQRIVVLERKLKAAEQARTGAYNALAKSEAARGAAETARAAAEASTVGKSRFLANMSHELRTPLNAIMGFSDIMRAKMFGELQGKYAEYAELIHESGRHLTDLINDVLDMSKIEAERYTLSREVFDAREAINGAMRLLRLQAEDAGVQLRGVAPPQPLIIDADRRALKQIVLNLVSNALKFTPSGGSVTVTAQAAGGMFELVVADTGAGIAKEDLERLGRPYEQAGDAEHKAQGTGLGLSLVKAFARLHGGELNIESAPGEGAAVSVRLPVLAEDAPRAGSAIASPSGLGGDVDAAPAVRTIATPAAEPERPRMGEVIPLNLQR